MTEHAETIQFVTEWLRACLPELEGVPIHILAREDDPTDEIWQPPCFTAKAICLTPDDRWPGAFAMMVADLAATPWWQLCGLALHEYCHHAIALADPPAPAPEGFFTREPGLEVIQALYQRVTSRVEPWFWHDDHFIAVVCHAWYRTIRADCSLLPDCAFVAGEGYGLSPFNDYFDLMRPEAELFADLPLSELAKLSVPRAVRALFQADTQRWREQHSENYF